MRGGDGVCLMLSWWSCSASAGGRGDEGQPSLIQGASTFIVGRTRGLGETRILIKFIRDRYLSRGDLTAAFCSRYERKGQRAYSR